MNNASLSLAVIVATLSLYTTSFAQGGPGRFEGQRGFMGPNQVMVVFDINSDGVIDEVEIAEASAALKKLDTNGDGKLTREEVQPAMPGRNRSPQAGGNSEEMVNRLMQYDKNGDGKVSKDELPERMQPVLQRGDTDNDGALSKEEIQKLAQNSPTTPPPGESRERRPERDDD